MATDTKIYLELSQDIQQLLSDNGLKIEDVLQQENIEAKIERGVIPTLSEETARIKSPVHIILASSVLITAISFAIVRVLNAIHNKPVLIDVKKFSIEKDENGNIHHVETTITKELLEQRKKNKEDSFEVHFGDWFLFKIDSKDNEMI